MIPCPACGAENPDGTRICVKCATELPQLPGAAAAAGAKTKKKVVEEVKPDYTLKDVGKDFRDALWLLLLLFLVFLGFLGEITHWTFRFTDREEAKLLDSMPQELPVPAKFISAEELYRQAKIKYDATLYSSSYKLLKKALDIDPAFAKAYFAMGYLYNRFDKDDEAVRMYDRALLFDPKNVDSMNNLAMMYYRAGNVDDAVSMLQKADSLDSKNEDVQYNLGRIYLDTNKLPEALEWLKKASASKPDDARPFNDLAICYEKQAKKQEAIDAWKKVLELSPDSDIGKQAQKHLDFLQKKAADVPSAPTPDSSAPPAPPPLP
jgi:Flp pilus assembly protein TadD